MDRRDRDPLAITVALASLAVQVMLWVWWGGRMAERQDAIDKRLSTVEIWRDANTNIDAHQDTAIAVLDQKLTSIQASIDAIAQKVGAKK